MDINVLVGLFGGLALFLYGMKMMSDGLEDVAGNRMKKIMEKLTANRFLGVAVGAAITAVIQSSSATTVMVVGFVNSSIMTLKQAVWIIMGANIGTTITGQLIALDIGLIAPLIAFLGVAMIVFLKSPNVHHTGKILAGLGILFIGMDMMGASMNPLRESEGFISLMTQFSNPLYAILAGALFTAVIQSSSASIGILQTLAVSGLIGFPNAVFVLFGQNIGTCITSVIASIGTNRAAKRTTLIHLMFNMLGTIIFTLLCIALPITSWVGRITPDNPAQQIANMHTIFNLATTLLLLPFGTLMARLAQRLLPDVKGEAEGSLSMALEEFRRGRTSLGSIAVHTDLLKQEIHRMVALATDNVAKAYEIIIKGNVSAAKKVTETEEAIDKLNKEISQYVSRILVHNNSGQNVEDVEQYFLISQNVERIGDHAVNIAGYADIIKGKSIAFSASALEEITAMQDITLGFIKRIINIDGKKEAWLKEINEIEQQIDDMTRTYRDTHLERMRKGECSDEACILYSELLTDFERIGDHTLNIAQALVKIHETA